MQNRVLCKKVECGRWKIKASMKAIAHRSSSRASKKAALFFCLDTHLEVSRGWEILFGKTQTNSRLRPIVVHQHAVDATADIIFSLSDLFQHQHPLCLLGLLLLVDPQLQALLLLHMSKI